MNSRKDSSHSWMLNFFLRAKKVYADTARDLLGDIWDASSADGLGLPREIKVAEYKKIGLHAYETTVLKKQLPDVTKIPTYFRCFHKRIPEFSHPAQVKILMQDNAKAVKGKDTSGIFTRLFGDHNIFEEETKSENWKRLSSEFHKHFFADPRLKRILPDMHDVTKKYLKEIEDNNGIADLANFAARFTMETAAVTQLGLINFPEDFMQYFFSVIDEAVQNIGNPKNSMPWPVSRVIELIDQYGSGHKTLDQIMAPGYARLATLLELNKENILSTSNWIRDVSLKRAWDPHNEKTVDDWQEALTTRDEKFVALLYSIPVLKDAGLSLVVGYETSAQTLQFMLTFLADQKHRPIVDAIRQEINNRNCDDLTKENLDQFIYLKAAFYETLRLRPPLAKMKGMVNRDVQVGDTLLRKGDYFFLSSLNVHTNEEVYKNPFVFDPERFLRKNKDGTVEFVEPDPSAFFPFGFAERKCPGRKFTKIEIMALVAMMLMKRNYVIDDPFCYRTEQGFNLRSAVKVSVKATQLEEKPQGQLVPR